MHIFGKFNLIAYEIVFLDRIDRPALARVNWDLYNHLYTSESELSQNPRYESGLGQGCSGYKKIMLIPGPDLACQDAVM